MCPLSRTVLTQQRDFVAGRKTVKAPQRTQNAPAGLDEVVRFVSQRVSMRLRRLSRRHGGDGRLGWSLSSNYAVHALS